MVTKEPVRSTIDAIMYYFDQFSARKPQEKAWATYIKAGQELWANPCSIHPLGNQTLKNIASSYADLYHYFGVGDEDTVLFCSSGQEAIATVLQGVYGDMSRNSGRNHFLTSCLDEASIILNLEKISSLGGSHHLVDALESGQIDLQALEESINPRTQMVALSWANALTGVIQPVEAIAKICNEKGLLLLLDASNLLGLYDLNLQSLPVDFITIHGNSLGAVMGTGAIWMRKPHQLSALLPCGHDFMHATASNPAALLSLGVAARESREEREKNVWRLFELRSLFEDLIQEKFKGSQVLFSNSERLVHVSAISFDGVHGEHLSWHLCRKEVYASFGGGSRQQMHYLLKACSVEPKLFHTALSFSFDPAMSDAFIDEATTIIADTATKLRRLHSF